MFTYSLMFRLNERMTLTPSFINTDSGGMLLENEPVEIEGTWFERRVLRSSLEPSIWQSAFSK